MKIDNNSMTIVVLCSHLCVGENIKPLTPNEWGKLAASLLENNIQPYELLSFTRKEFKEKLYMKEDEIDRFEKLISRSASIAFDLEKLANIGINIITRADKEYPKQLKKKLGKTCPPLFYCVGNNDLLDHNLIGFVGSRSVGKNDVEFTKKTVKKVIDKNMGVVSGGAKGVDSIATEQALALGGFAVEFISDSLLRKLKNPEIINAVRKGKLLILSVAKPDAGFNVGFAMMRNKYIYASSVATVVVKSDLKKGGTWSGAMENLKKNWTNVFCWNNNLYNGNMELISNGALPIDVDWDVTIDIEERKISEQSKQISLFDL